MTSAAFSATPRSQGRTPAFASGIQRGDSQRAGSQHGGKASNATAVAARGGHAAPGAVIAGKVVFDGKPLAQASLEFHATGRSGNGGPVSLRVETNHEGVFRRTAAVGFPAGTYAVVVKSGCIMPHPNAEIGRPVRIPARYASVASTPLAVEVKPEASAFDLVLRH
jgi:hypothetical protein